MKKILTLTALVLAAILFVVGCARTPNVADLVEGALKGQKTDLDLDLKDEVGKILEDVAGVVDEGKDFVIGGDDDSFGQEGSLESEFYKYQDARGDLISNINRSIFQNLSLEMGSYSELLSIYEVDAIMWASSILWDSDQVLEQIGRLYGIGDIKIERGKDRAVMTYTDENGAKLTFTSNFYEAEGRLVMVADFEDGRKPYMEFVRTPYGYAGQTYMGGAVMLSTLYLFSIEGDNGIIGIVQDSGEPDPLTGKEAYDFPKSAAEWYQYQDGKMTGVSRDGEKVGEN